MRTTSFSLLTILCLALSATAFAQTFSEGPNGFIAGASGSPGGLEFGLWLASGLTPSTISYELGSSAFGTDLGSGTVALNGSTNHFLFTNGFGYDVYDIGIEITPAAMTAGNRYWVSLSNANDTSNSGTGAWDIPNGGSGGPAICNVRQSGTNFGDCGLGGESFTFSACCGPPVPEPSSILLFGSGILGLAGILRRKLNR